MDFKERKKIDVDALYRRLGRPGRFQIAVYLMLCCNYFPVVLNHLVMAMYGARTSYVCDLPEDFLNSTKRRYGESANAEAARCDVTINGVNGTDGNVTLVCPAGWKYDVEAREKNIITEKEDPDVLPALLPCHGLTCLTASLPPEPGPLWHSHEVQVSHQNS